jgi:hypothetical protein
MDERLIKYTKSQSAGLMICVLHRSIFCHFCWQGEEQSDMRHIINCRFRSALLLIAK